MVSFVETTEIESAEVDSLVGDASIGLLRAGRDEWINGDIRLNVRRLRRAILAYEDEFDGSTQIELAIVEPAGETNGLPMLALVPVDGSSKAVILAPIVAGHPQDHRSGADELVDVYDEDGETA